MSQNLRHWICPVFICSIIITTIPSSLIEALYHSGELSDLDLYKIAWLGPLTTNEIFDDQNVINISTSSSEQYKCIVPGGEQLNFDSSAKNSSSEKPQESPIQILEPLLRSNYCSLKIELFWVYELCHGKFLKQYHEETVNHKPKVTQQYYLGKFNEEQIKEHEVEFEKKKAELDRTGKRLPTILVKGHYKPYVTLNMTGGTKCDLTKKPRSSRIIYVCNEEQKHELYSLKEVATCEYEAIVLTPLLCKHKDFKSDTITLQEIRCFSIGESPKRPLKSLKYQEEEMDLESDMKKGKKRRSVAYLQGKTLIIDADLLLS